MNSLALLSSNKIGQLRSAEEWEELTERNVKLESRIKELLNKLEEELRIGELRKVVKS